MIVYILLLSYWLDFLAENVERRKVETISTFVNRHFPPLHHYHYAFDSTVHVERQKMSPVATFPG